MAANLEPGSELRPTGSKLDLIQATVAAISRTACRNSRRRRSRAPPGTRPRRSIFTSAARKRCCSRRLREVSEEFAAVDRDACWTRPGRTTCAHCSASSTRASAGGLSDSHKIAVWYAFLAESKARGDYQRICGERDAAWSRMVIDLCKRSDRRAWPRQVARRRGGRPGPHGTDRPAVAGHPVRRRRVRSRGRAPAVPCLSLQCFSVARDAHRGALRRRARARVGTRGGNGSAAARDAARLGLLEHEDSTNSRRSSIFLSSWQIVCHVSELAETGDYWPSSSSAGADSS